MSRHCELGPHGDGTQGSKTTGAVGLGGGATRTQVIYGQAPQIHITHTNKQTSHAKITLADTAKELLV